MLPLPHRATLCLEPTGQANCRARKGVVEYASLSTIGGAMTQLLCPRLVLLNLNHSQLTAYRSTRRGNYPVLFYWVYATSAINQLTIRVLAAETTYPDSVIIILGDFNHTNLKKVLSRYKQHVNCSTRNNNTLDHCYTIF